MADFYEGFVYECNVTGALTIEGNQVEDFKPSGDGKPVSGLLPSLLRRKERITAASVKEFVRIYLHRTGAIEYRATARERHLAELSKGKHSWNAWRRDHPEEKPILSGAKRKKFDGMCLDGYDFSYANLTEAKLQGIHFKGANFHQAILARADLSHAHLERANFCRTDLYETNLQGAHLDGANLQGTQMAMTNLTGANLSGCTVYGMSAWDLNVTGTKENDLIVRYKPVGAKKEEDLVVEGLDLAAFTYFALNNKNIARIISGANRKWVLILGRFDPGLELLEKIATVLKKQHLIPIKFDFHRAAERDLIETVILLAGLSLFVIVDISDPRSTPLELQAIASNYGVPIVPIIKSGSKPFASFSGLRKFRWIFRPFTYDSAEDLVKRLPAEVIAPALEEAGRLVEEKRMAESE